MKFCYLNTFIKIYCYPLWWTLYKEKVNYYLNIWGDFTESKEFSLHKHKSFNWIPGWELSSNFKNVFFFLYAYVIVLLQLKFLYTNELKQHVLNLQSYNVPKTALFYSNINPFFEIRSSWGKLISCLTSLLG